jgi:hypothetical protein
MEDRKTENDALAALTERIYAESDLLPSKVRNPHGFDLRRDDAAMLARAILSSDWLAERGVIPPEGSPS